MSNEPPESGASEPEPPEDPPTRPLPAQTPSPQQPPPPRQPPPGYPPPPPPYAQPGPHGGPPQQPGPYGAPPQPQQPPPSQPLWQGHLAPQQYPPQQGWPGQPQYGAAPAQPKGRKGLLIGLLIVLALGLVATAVVTALILADNSDSGIEVKDISSGDCLVGSGLADADEEISDIEKVDCDDDHDAEVFATFELGNDQDLDAAGSQCVDEAAAAGRPLEDLEGDDLEIRPLVAGDEPEEGDKVVCFIRHPDGTKLSGSDF